MCRFKISIHIFRKLFFSLFFSSLGLVYNYVESISRISHMRYATSALSCQRRVLSLLFLFFLPSALLITRNTESQNLNNALFFLFYFILSLSSSQLRHSRITESRYKVFLFFRERILSWASAIRFLTGQWNRMPKGVT